MTRRSEVRVETLPDAEAVAQRAAVYLAERARAAIARRGHFLLATSGGSTPWRMLELFSQEALPWEQVLLFQVDERVAPRGDPARNLTHLQQTLLDRVPARAYPMPVEGDLEAGARDHAQTLRQLAGDPPRLDLVHLGLGPDGHTASLVPGDPVLDCPDLVGLTAPYQGHRRMTLTWPVLTQARALLWVVTGASKVEALRRLRAGDRAIPAGRVPQARALLLADLAAVG